MPFRPGNCASIKLSATTTTGTTSLVFESPHASRPTVRIVSPAGSSDIAFVRFGVSDITATAETNGAAILPGSSQVFQLESSDSHIAVDCPTSTATLYVLTGEGGD